MSTEGNIKILKVNERPLAHLFFWHFLTPPKLAVYCPFQGFYNSDCSRRLCPKGDDPLTQGQNYRTVSITTGSSKGSLDGILVLSFNGEEFEIDADANKVDGNFMAQKFSSLRNVEQVDVTRSEVDENSGATYTVTFLKFPTIPHENNIHSNNGNPALSSFSCNTTLVKGEVYSPICEFKSVESSNLVEYVQCSNHGECSEITGKCKCDPGWNGLACDDNRDAGDVEKFLAEGPFFTGNVLNLEASRDKSKGFKFITATASYGRDEIFTVAGNGNVTLGSGDLSVKSGGVSIEGGQGLAVSSKSGSKFPSISGISSGGGAAFYCTGHDFESDVLLLSADRDASPSFDFVKAVAGGKDIFRIGGDGKFTLTQSLVVADSNLGDGAGAVASGGVDGEGAIEFARVEAPMVVARKAGVVVREGGGVLVEEGGGLSVLDGTSSFESSSVKSALVLSRRGSGEASFEASITAADDAGGDQSATTAATLKIKHDGDGAASDASFVQLTDKNDIDVFEINSLGKMIVGSGGLSVNSGGINVDSGGVGIGGGGLTVQGGIEVQTGDVKLTGSEQAFEVSGAGLRGVNNMGTGSALFGKATDENFSGSLVDLVGGKVRANVRGCRLGMELSLVRANIDVTDALWCADIP